MVLKNKELIRNGVIGQLEKDENINAGSIRVDVSEGTVTLNGIVNCFLEKNLPVKMQHGYWEFNM